MAGEVGGVLYIALFIFGLVLLVCWIVLPFALIGTKAILRELVREQRRTNALLEAAARDRAERP
jgi:threonine/homoserine/homoserine lactone efflux protein